MFEFYDYFNNKVIKPNDTLKEDYHPIISNDKIGLFSKSQSDISMADDFSSLIIKNDTLEIIGDISFFEHKIEDMFYGGNVSYSINKNFRNKGYGTQSLALLKEVLKENVNAKDVGLLISTLPTNIYSQKVAINNGGVLIYEGEVPKDNLLYAIDHVKEVKIYKISM